MQKNNEVWDVATATAWVSSYPWGAALIAQLTASREPDCTVRWLRMVMRMRTEMRSSAAVSGAEVDGDDSEIDVAGWPALVARLYD